MPVDVVETLCDLVRLPSVNPMGRDVQGDVYFEHRVTDYLQQLFQRWGVPWIRQPVAPGQLDERGLGHGGSGGRSPVEEGSREEFAHGQASHLAGSRGVVAGGHGYRPPRDAAVRTKQILFSDFRAAFLTDRHLENLPTRINR